MSTIALNDDLRSIAADLPKTYATRWSASRKAAVVRAVQAEVLSLGKALDTYRLSLTEFRSWQQNYANAGVPGLRAGELQDNR